MNIYSNDNLNFLLLHKPLAVDDSLTIEHLLCVLITGLQFEDGCEQQPEK